MKKLIVICLVVSSGLLFAGCTSTKSSRGFDGTCKVEIKDGDKVIKSCEEKCSDLDSFATDCKNSK